MYIYAYIFTNTHSHVNSFLCMFTYMNINIHMYVYMYENMYMYMQLYMCRSIYRVDTHHHLLVFLLTCQLKRAKGHSHALVELPLIIELVALLKQLHSSTAARSSPHIDASHDAQSPRWLWLLISHRWPIKLASQPFSFLSSL